MEAKKTPLYDEHVRLGGKIVEFAGWQMPVQYEGLRAEHHNVRKNVGLFDVSHMGEIRLRGEKALDSAEWLTSNSVTKLENGDAQYSLLTNDSGGIVDDLIVYCIEKNRDYLFCVNAANIEKDWQWIQKHNKGADITNESEQWAQIAIQGPKALALLDAVFSAPISEMGSFTFKEIPFGAHSCFVARTGYTGEDGCEVFVPNDGAVTLWQTLMEKGQPHGVQPIGLGARDTLRTEMKYSLYGHEIDDTTNPYMAGLGWVVKPKLKDFLGKEKIVQAKEAGLSQKLVGFRVLDKGIARENYKILSPEGEEIGHVTSGTLSPSLDAAIGIAYVDKKWASEDSELLVEIRSRRVKAQVVKTPFVTPGGK